MKIIKTVALLSIALNIGLAYYCATKKPSVPAPTMRQKLSEILSSPEYIARQEKFEQEQPQTGGIVMYGDSLTQMGEWNAVLPGHNMVNRGISTDNTFSTTKRLCEVARLKPSRIFMLFATNDLYLGDELPAIIDRYDHLLERLNVLAPQAKVYIQSVPPVTPVKGIDLGGLQPARIKEINTMLRTLASKHGMEYIDITPALADQVGGMNMAHSKDGIHVLHEGYIKWASVLRPYLTQ